MASDFEYADGDDVWSIRRGKKLRYDRVGINSLKTHTPEYGGELFCTHQIPRTQPVGSP